MTTDTFCLETAACLWEAVLGLKDHPADDHVSRIRAAAIARCFETLGTAALRITVVEWTDRLDTAWRLVQDSYDGCFDWDFVPGWIAAHIDWSDPGGPVISRHPCCCLLKRREWREAEWRACGGDEPCPAPETLEP